MAWWNAQTDGRVLDLWIAWYQFTKDPDAMQPADEQLTKLIGKLSDGR